MGRLRRDGNMAVKPLTGDGMRQHRSRPGTSIADPSVAVEPIAHYERSMARIVQKFGGTSVADIERIGNAACRVKREVDAGNEVAVVVSAMAGATNQLVDWTRKVNPLH